jgi:NADH-quinone oxidoreductase subunit N
VNYAEFFGALLPETVLVLTALAVLLVDLAGLRELKPGQRFLGGALVSVVGCAVAIALIGFRSGSASLLEGMLVIDPLTRLVKVSILVLGIFTCVLTLGTRLNSNVGEYFCLLLLALTGLLLLVSSENLLVIFLALELASLCLYLLAGFDSGNRRSVEAGLKYFLFGGMSAAFTLFGFSLLYGLTGHIDLRLMVGAINQHADPLLVVGVVMVFAGFGFKIAAVPFHLWAPDAYQAAPVPSAALIASGSKVASFYVLTRVVFTGLGGTTGTPGTTWFILLAVVAAASMLLGNLAALVQSSVRRLLAFSAIAHAGYLLIGVLSPGGTAIPALTYYLIIYGITTVGAFGVVALVEARDGHDRASAFAGLSQTSPVLAFCLLVFLLSLAGIPPLGGFFAKFYLFAEALKSAPGNPILLGLVILAVATSALSLYYYLQVLKEVYVRPPLAMDRPQIPRLAVVSVLVLALLVILLGVFPQRLVHALEAARAASAF